MDQQEIALIFKSIITLEMKNDKFTREQLLRELVGVDPYTFNLARFI